MGVRRDAVGRLSLVEGRVGRAPGQDHEEGRPKVTQIQGKAGPRAHGTSRRGFRGGAAPKSLHRVRVPGCGKNSPEGLEEDRRQGRWLEWKEGEWEG